MEISSFTLFSPDVGVAGQQPESGRARRQRPRSGPNARQPEGHRPDDGRSGLVSGTTRPVRRRPRLLRNHAQNTRRADPPLPKNVEGGSMATSALRTTSRSWPTRTIASVAVAVLASMAAGGHRVVGCRCQRQVRRTPWKRYTHLMSPVGRREDSSPPGHVAALSGACVLIGQFGRGTRSVAGSAGADSHRDARRAGRTI
jgi:hypothetical protein